MTTWSLVTVTYNSAPQIREYWSAIRPSNVEWIVVDNASSDDSVEAARAAGATHVLQLGKNCGFGFANNVGLSIAEGAYAAFVNPDVRVDYSSLPAMQAAIDERHGLVCPQLLNVDGSLQPNGRGFPTLQNKVANRLGRLTARYFITAESGESRFICWAIGAAVAAEKATFEALGAWDERFFIYYEDSDICLRAWDAGLSVEVDGSARWIHGWSRETTRFRLMPWIREFASMSKFYRKYPHLLWFERLAARRYPLIDSRTGRRVVLDAENHQLGEVRLSR